MGGTLGAPRSLCRFRGAPRGSGAAGTGTSRPGLSPAACAARPGPVCRVPVPQSRDGGEGGTTRLWALVGGCSPPPTGRRGHLFRRMGELWKKGQGGRGARAGLAGLAGSSQSALPLQIIVTSAQPEPSPSVRRHHNLSRYQSRWAQPLAQDKAPHLCPRFQPGQLSEANGVSGCR